ncbi:uncharacterized protein BO95DRAFT_518740 [Aspergillus brunneoviolaceus CBS 621.78]|uniref:Uncharacterized protein n=1 Tax=Aspergillus brunneoviolaceus CBS 621.78 TaxID=1450534 RepID=A0ACD1FTP5_9EURO|nr:hypothetical protein BO95DRAFT_518740 [Aspergillus brunneoviolaceus CBS 621.78]RAH40370.1 hypothetical protein BO95DRAFT_518740 [Aspergillus brunneoviolaceus CBS 621.78]
MYLRSTKYDVFGNSSNPGGRTEPVPRYLANAIQISPARGSCNPRDYCCEYLDETLIKVEVHRPEETCLFATELQQYRETIHQVSQILQHAARQRERGPRPDSSTAPPQLEIHPCRKRRITISWEESRSSTFPQPAPFHPTLLPDHLTTELGPKVSDMAGLERSAREIAKHVGGDNIVI